MNRKKIKKKQKIVNLNCKFKILSKFFQDSELSGSETNKSRASSMNVYPNANVNFKI